MDLAIRNLLTCPPLRYIFLTSNLSLPGCKSQNGSSGTVFKRTARYFRSISWWLKIRFATHLTWKFERGNSSGQVASKGDSYGQSKKSLPWVLLDTSNFFLAGLAWWCAGALKNKVMSVAASWPFWHSYQQRRYQTADLRSSIVIWTTGSSRRHEISSRKPNLDWSYPCPW